MDTKWLIAIVIANVIAAIVKESVAAFIKRMPKMMATLIGKLRPRVMSVLSRHWRIIVDGGFTLYSWGALVLFMRSKDPVTRGDVVAISFMTCMLFYWQTQLVLDVRRST